MEEDSREDGSSSRSQLESSSTSSSSVDEHDSVVMRGEEYGTSRRTEAVFREHADALDRANKLVVNKRFFMGSAGNVSNDEVYFKSDITTPAVRGVLGIVADKAVRNAFHGSRRPICLIAAEKAKEEMSKPALDEEIEAAQRELEVDALRSKHSQVHLDDKIHAESPRALSLVIPRGLPAQRISRATAMGEGASAASSTTGSSSAAAPSGSKTSRSASAPGRVHRRLVPSSISSATPLSPRQHQHQHQHQHQLGPGPDPTAVLEAARRRQLRQMQRLLGGSGADEDSAGFAPSSTVSPVSSPGRTSVRFEDQAADAKQEEEEGEDEGEDEDEEEEEEGGEQNDAGLDSRSGEVNEPGRKKPPPFSRKNHSKPFGWMQPSQGGTGHGRRQQSFSIPVPCAKPNLQATAPPNPISVVAEAAVRAAIKAATASATGGVPFSPLRSPQLGSRASPGHSYSRGRGLDVDVGVLGRWPLVLPDEQPSVLSLDGTAGPAEDDDWSQGDEPGPGTVSPPAGHAQASADAESSFPLVTRANFHSDGVSQARKQQRAARRWKYPFLSSELAALGDLSIGQLMECLVRSSAQHGPEARLSLSAELAQVFAGFRRLDVDGDGFLSARDLAVYNDRYQGGLVETELSEALWALDDDMRGGVSFDEVRAHFLRLRKELSVEEEALARAKGRVRRGGAGGSGAGEEPSRAAALLQSMGLGLARDEVGKNKKIPPVTARPPRSPANRPYQEWMLYRLLLFASFQSEHSHHVHLLSALQVSMLTTLRC